MPENPSFERGYRQVEHSADLAVEIWGPSEEALLVEAARAVVDLLTDGAEVAEVAERHIELDTLDAEDRLVQWLNELIFAAIAEGFLVRAAHVVLRPGGLAAMVRGEERAGDKIRTELKSATYHDLHVQSGPDGWRARVVIDV
jgi:SHS2 domain-containing protein